MKTTFSNIAFIHWSAVRFSRESVYEPEEIAWLMEVLYSFTCKTKEHVIDATKTVIIKSANSNIISLFQLYKHLIDNNCIKPLHVKRKTYDPNHYVTDKILKRLESTIEKV